MNILNICDINDEAKNIYHNELLKYFDENQIYSNKPDPKMNPSEYLFRLMSAKFDLVVGHGFGGLLALIVGRVTGVKTILINPMYPASRYWSEFLSDYEYKDFLEYITEKDICWDTDGKTTENVYLILGKDDDLIDTSTTDKYLTEGNSFYVNGGHWPSGEDFALKFGELTGGLLPTGDSCNDIKERQMYLAFSEFIQKEAEYKLIYLYTDQKEDSDRLTSVSVKYLRSLEDSSGLKCRYLTADSLPTDGTEVREHFKDLDFLIVDKIVSIVLSDEIRRSLWIACDEVTGHGGKVLLLSDTQAADLFKEDRQLMNLIYTGIIRKLCVYDYSIGSGGNCSFESNRGDRRPYEDNYRTVIIDDIKTKYGNLAIKWHSPNLEKKELYLYFKDGQWLYDADDGWCSSSQAKAVLLAAVDKFVDGAKETDHDAHDFWGWVW